MDQEDFSATANPLRGEKGGRHVDIDSLLARVKDVNDGHHTSIETASETTSEIGLEPDATTASETVAERDPESGNQLQLTQPPQPPQCAKLVGTLHCLVGDAPTSSDESESEGESDSESESPQSAPLEESYEDWKQRQAKELSNGVLEEYKKCSSTLAVQADDCRNNTPCMQGSLTSSVLGGKRTLLVVADGATASIRSDVSSDKRVLKNSQYTTTSQSSGTKTFVTPVKEEPVSKLPTANEDDDEGSDDLANFHRGKEGDKLLIGNKIAKHFLEALTKKRNQRKTPPSRGKQEEKPPLPYFPGLRDVIPQHSPDTELNFCLALLNEVVQQHESLEWNEEHVKALLFYLLLRDMLLFTEADWKIGSDNATLMHNRQLLEDCKFILSKCSSHLSNPPPGSNATHLHLWFEQFSSNLVEIDAFLTKAWQELHQLVPENAALPLSLPFQSISASVNVDRENILPDEVFQDPTKNNENPTPNLSQLLRYAGNSWSDHADRLAAEDRSQFKGAVLLEVEQEHLFPLAEAYLFPDEPAIYANGLQHLPYPPFDASAHSAYDVGVNSLNMFIERYREILEQKAEESEHDGAYYRSKSTLAYWLAYCCLHRNITQVVYPNIPFADHFVIPLDTGVLKHLVLRTDQERVALECVIRYVETCNRLPAGNKNPKDTRIPLLADEKSYHVLERVFTKSPYTELLGGRPFDEVVREVMGDAKDKKDAHWEEVEEKKQKALELRSEITGHEENIRMWRSEIDAKKVAWALLVHNSKKEERSKTSARKQAYDRAKSGEDRRHRQEEEAIKQQYNDSIKDAKSKMYITKESARQSCKERLEAAEQTRQDALRASEENLRETKAKHKKKSDDNVARNSAKTEKKLAGLRAKDKKNYEWHTRLLSTFNVDDDVEDEDGLWIPEKLFSRLNQVRDFEAKLSGSALQLSTLRKSIEETESAFASFLSEQEEDLRTKHDAAEKLHQETCHKADSAFSEKKREIEAEAETATRAAQREYDHASSNFSSRRQTAIETEGNHYQCNGEAMYKSWRDDEEKIRDEARAERDAAEKDKNALIRDRDDKICNAEASIKEAKKQLKKVLIPPPPVIQSISEKESIARVQVFSLFLPLPLIRLAQLTHAVIYRNECNKNGTDVKVSIEVGPKTSIRGTSKAEGYDFGAHFTEKTAFQDMQSHNLSSAIECPLSKYFHAFPAPVLLDETVPSEEEALRFRCNPTTRKEVTVDDYPNADSGVWYPHPEPTIGWDPKSCVRLWNSPLDARNKSKELRRVRAFTERLAAAETENEDDESSRVDWDDWQFLFHSPSLSPQEAKRGNVAVGLREKGPAQDLKKDEILGQLRATEQRQFAKLCVALRENSLDFTMPLTATVIRQLLFQVGSFKSRTNKDNNNIAVEWNVRRPFEARTLRENLHHSLETRLDFIQDRQRDYYELEALADIISLHAQLVRAEFGPIMQCTELTRRLIKIALRWVRSIEEDDGFEGCEQLRQKRHTILCLAMRSLRSCVISGVFNVDDAKLMIMLAVAVNQSKPDLAEDPRAQRISRDCVILTSQLLLQFRRLSAEEKNQALTEGLASVYGRVSATTQLSWTEVNGVGGTFLATDSLSKDDFHLAVTNGEVLVNHAPLGLLPHRITDDPLFEATFGVDMNLKVDRTGSKFSTTSPYHGCFYDFYLCPKTDGTDSLRVFEYRNDRAEETRLELIPSSCFEGKFPEHILRKASFWYSSAKKSILVRGKTLPNRHISHIITSQAIPSSENDDIASAATKGSLECCWCFEIPRHRQAEFESEWPALLVQEKLQELPCLFLTPLCDDHLAPLLSVFSRFEHPEYIDITRTNATTLEVDLWRYKWKFEVTNSTDDFSAVFVSPVDKRAYVLSPVQHLDNTLLGITTYFVLEKRPGHCVRHANSLYEPQHLVAVPDSLTFQHGVAVSLTGKDDACESLKYQMYTVHDSTGWLEGRSVAARLHLGALYAAVSCSDFADPRVKMTGVEHALDCVRRCWQAHPFSDNEAAKLKKVLDLGRQHPTLDIVVNMIWKVSQLVEKIHSTPLTDDATPVTVDAALQDVQSDDAANAEDFISEDPLSVSKYIELVAGGTIGFHSLLTEAEKSLLHTNETLALKLKPSEMKIQGMRPSALLPRAVSTFYCQHLKDLDELLTESELSKKAVPDLELSFLCRCVTSSPSATQSEFPLESLSTSDRSKLDKHHWDKLKRSWSHSSRSWHDLKMKQGMEKRLESIIEQTRGQFKEDAEAISKRLLHLMNDPVEQFLNDEPKDSGNRATFAIYNTTRLARRMYRAQVGIRELVAIFALETEDERKKHLRLLNPFLTSEAIDKIVLPAIQRVMEYDIFEERLQRIEALTQILENQQAASDSSPGGYRSDRDGILARIAIEVLSMRVWDAKEHREWLVFEWEGRLQIRPLQYFVANEMLCGKKDGRIMQLNMGEGKTRVIMPMLMLSLSRKRVSRERLRIMTYFLPQLLDQSYAFLQENLTASILNLKLVRFVFHRQIQVSETSLLKNVAKLFDWAKRMGAPIVSTPSSYHSFHLKGELLQADGDVSNQDVIKGLLPTQAVMEASAEDENENESNPANLNQEIVHLYDESDEILHHHYQLVYAAGEKGKLSNRVARGIALEALLFTVHHLVTESPDEFWVQHSSDASATTNHPASTGGEPRIVYQAGVANQQRPGYFGTVRIDSVGAPNTLHNGHPVSQINEKIARTLLENAHPDLSWLPRWFDNDERKNAFVAITCDSQCNPVIVTRDYHIHFGNNDKDKWEQLLALRGFLAFDRLVGVLQKRVNINFGLDGRRKKEIGIPYRSCDTPSDRSEYSDADTTLVATFLSHFEKGLSRDAIKYVFNDLFKRRQAGSSFYRMWLKYSRQEMRAEGNYERLRELDQLDLTNGNVIDLLEKYFKYNLATASYFVQQQIIERDITQYPARLQSTPHHLANVRYQCGFSGTNDNNLILPAQVTPFDAMVATSSEQQTDDVSEVQHMEPEQRSEWLCSLSRSTLQGTDGFMMEQILHNTLSGEGGVTILPDEDIQNGILKLAIKLKANALIDVGAQLYGRSNKEYAEKFLELKRNATGDHSPQQLVSYSHTNVKTQERVWMMVRSDGQEWTRQASPYEERDSFVIYDQYQCRGSDLKLNQDAVALVTLSTTLTKEELVQAVGRLREISRGQKICFAVPKSASIQICHLLDVDESAITPRHVFAFSLSNTIRATRKALPLWGIQGVHFLASQEHPKRSTRVSEKNSLDDLYKQARTPLKTSDIVKVHAREYKGFRGNEASLDAWLQMESVRPIMEKCVEYGTTDETARNEDSSVDDECERETQNEVEIETEAEKEVDSAEIVDEVSWNVSELLCERGIGKLSAADHQCAFDRVAVRKNTCIAQLFGSRGPGTIHWTRTEAAISYTSNFHHAVRSSASDRQEGWFRRVTTVLFLPYAKQLVLLAEQEAERMVQFLHRDQEGRKARFEIIHFCESDIDTNVAKFGAITTAALMLLNGNTTFDPRPEMAHVNRTTLNMSAVLRGLQTLIHRASKRDLLHILRCRGTDRSFPRSQLEQLTMRFHGPVEPPSPQVYMV